MGMNIEINVGAQIKLLRNNTFSDPLSFIDENIQNAQRAKSSGIYITYDEYDNTMTFEDDGCGLKDPQSLLHIASSGWEDCNESPFGQGFFSNIAIADEIHVVSNNFKVDMDVEKMMCGDLEVDVTTADENQYEGFKLTLDYMKDLDGDDVKARILDIAQYLPQKVLYNNIECPKKDFMKIPDELVEKAIKVDSVDMKGWIALTNDYSHSVKLFYCGRLVQTLSQYHATGEIHMIDDSLLDLRAPDRKDIIDNNKFDDFNDKIEKKMSELALRLIIEDKYSTVALGVKEYAKEEEALKYMKFSVYNSKDINQLKDLVALTNDIKSPEVESPKVLLATGNDISSNKVNGETESSHEDNRTSSGSLGSSGSSGSVTEDLKTKLSIIDSNRIVYYLEKRDVYTLRDSIEYCRSYDIDVILCTNKFEMHMCQYLQNKGHKISELKKLSKKLNYSVVLNKEQKGIQQIRAERIMKTILKSIGFNYDVYVGSVKVLRKLSSQEVSVDVGMIFLDNVLYVNDNIINLTNLSSNSNNKWASESKWLKSDAKFILENMVILEKCLDKVEFDNKKDICGLIGLTVAGLL